MKFSDLQSLIKILKYVVVLFSVLNLAGIAIAGETQFKGAWGNSNAKESYKIVIAEEDDENILVNKFEGGIRIS